MMVSSSNWARTWRPCVGHAFACSRYGSVISRMGALRGSGGSGLLDHAGVHPHQFPGVAVGILEAVAVHEAVVLLFGQGGAAGGDGLLDEVIDVGAALARQARQHLRG